MTSDSSDADAAVEAAAAKPAEVDDAPLDLDSRVLCPDGNCVGVIGPDGRCKVCGTPLPEAERAAAAEVGPVAHAGSDPDPRAEGDAPLDFADRKLCSDGACIGVIGPDGRCKECGKPYTGEPQD
jgi:hypothetical protein